MWLKLYPFTKVIFKISNLLYLKGEKITTYVNQLAVIISFFMKIELYYLLFICPRQIIILMGLVTSFLVFNILPLSSN